MRALVFLLLILSHLPLLPPSYAGEDEQTDSAVGAEQAAELAADGSEQAYENYKFFLEQANEADRAASEASRRAKLLHEAGRTDEANEALEQAKDFAKKRDQALARSDEEYEQSGDLAETSNAATQLNRALTADDDAGNQFGFSKPTENFETKPPQLNPSPSKTSEALIEQPLSNEAELFQGSPTRGSPDSVGDDITHTAKRLTGPSGGNVPITKGCPDGGTVCFVGDNAQATNGNHAMPNAYDYFKSLYPDHTYAVSTLDEIAEIKAKYPPGTKFIGAFHGADTGIKIGETEIVTPNSPELQQMSEIFEGSNLALMTCGAANIRGLCSTLAKKTNELTAYDQTIFAAPDGFSAREPNTSEHVWRPSGAAIEPGEVVQPSLESQTVRPTQYVNEWNQLPFRPGTPQEWLTSAPSAGVYSGAVSSSGLSSTMPFMLAALSSFSGAGGVGSTASETAASIPQSEVAPAVTSSDNQPPRTQAVIDPTLPKETNLLGQIEKLIASSQTEPDQLTKAIQDTTENTILMFNQQARLIANSGANVSSPTPVIQDSVIGKGELTIHREPASQKKVARPSSVSPFASLLNK